LAGRVGKQRFTDFKTLQNFNVKDLVYFSFLPVQLTLSLLDLYKDSSPLGPDSTPKSSPPSSPYFLLYLLEQSGQTTPSSRFIFKKGFSAHPIFK